MNKAIPIIAIQLSAFVIENWFTLNFVKILDLAVTFEEDDQVPQEIVDRKYWELRSNPVSIGLLDSMIGLVRSITEPRSWSRRRPC